MLITLGPRLPPSGTWYLYDPLELGKFTFTQNKSTTPTCHEQSYVMVKELHPGTILRINLKFSKLDETPELSQSKILQEITIEHHHKLKKSFNKHGFTNKCLQCLCIASLSCPLSQL